MGPPGVTAIDSNPAPPVARTATVVVPLIPPEDALIVAVPTATAVTKPAELTVTTDEFDELQFAEVVTFWVELLLKTAVAVSCCVPPAVIVADEGVVLTATMFP